MICIYVHQINLFYLTKQCVVCFPVKGDDRKHNKTHFWTLLLGMSDCWVISFVWNSHRLRFSLFFCTFAPAQHVLDVSQ